MSRILRIKAHDKFSSSPNNSKNVFDRHAGLQYSEVICHTGPMRADWVWKTLGSSRQLKVFRSIGPGCSSMMSTAIRTVLTNLTSLTPESLETVPWLVGQMLWERICAQYGLVSSEVQYILINKCSNLDSLHIWKVFAVAYAGEAGDTSLKHWQIVISQPDMALPSYIKPITSTSIQWITNLHLSQVVCSRHELIHLSKLSNLETLTIGNGVEVPETGFDDGIVRAWARSATEGGAFSVLRILALRSQNLITSKIFTNLNSFPLLSVLLAEKCSLGSRDKPAARSLGWRYGARNDLADFLIYGGTLDASWDSILNAFLFQGSLLGVKILTEEGVEAISRRPRLNFSLGPVPVNLTLDNIGIPRLHYFRREAGSDLTSESTSSKRMLSEVQPGQPNKKRMTRVSKQQDIDHSLMAFAT